MAISDPHCHLKYSLLHLEGFLLILQKILQSLRQVVSLLKPVTQSQNFVRKECLCDVCVFFSILLLSMKCSIFKMVTLYFWEKERDVQFTTRH